MKTITFTYTKKDGITSERTLLVMVSPGGDKFAGIDVSAMMETDPVMAVDFCMQADKMHDEYITQMQLLQSQFDLKHNYRQFLVSGMSDITEV